MMELQAAKRGERESWVRNYWLSKNYGYKRLLYDAPTGNFKGGIAAEMRLRGGKDLFRYSGAETECLSRP